MAPRVGDGRATGYTWAMRHRRSLPLAIAVLSTLALAACDDGQASTPPRRPPPSGAPSASAPALPPPPLPPPEITWQGDSARIRATEPPYRQVDATLSARIVVGTGDAPLQLRVDAARLPSGTTLTALDGTSRVAAVHERLELPLPDLGAIPLAALDGPVEVALGASLELTTPGRAPVTTVVPRASFDLRIALREAFELVQQGPVRFATGPGPLDTAVIVEHGRMQRRLGSGATLADLDWVVHVTRRPSGRHKRCSGYSGGVDTVTINFADEVLTIHELRTGRQVAVEVMSPPLRCPRFVMVRDGESEESVTQDDVTRRVARLLAAGSGRRAR